MGKMTVTLSLEEVLQLQTGETVRVTWDDGDDPRNYRVLRCADGTIWATGEEAGGVVVGDAVATPGDPELRHRVERVYATAPLPPRKPDMPAPRFAHMTYEELSGLTHKDFPDPAEHRAFTVGTLAGLHIAVAAIRSTAQMAKTLGDANVAEALLGSAAGMESVGKAVWKESRDG